MRRMLCMTGLAVLILWCGAAGCKTNQAVREKPLPDPLLTSKKPVEGRPSTEVSGLAAREVLPPPPAFPALPGDAGRPSESSVVNLLAPRPVR